MDINIGIEPQTRKEIVTGLEKVLADTYTLYLKTHNYHWNVTGPHFRTLHTMFEEHYNEMWMAIDEIAERIRALGSFAPGSGAQFNALSSIDEADGVPAAMKMVEDLVAGHEAVIRTTRAALAPAAKADDEATVDLLTQRLQIHEKTAWMLRSLLA
jgi:starvation-inducible DNA-binding protein